MAKAASPLRLQAELMQAASLTASRMHRSTAQQIEYWATLGRQVADFVDPDALLEVAAGLARLRVEPTIARSVDPDVVFNAVEADRLSGELPAKVTTAAIRYQVSSSCPGFLERVDENGARTIGSFRNGVFTAYRPGEGD